MSDTRCHTKKVIGCATFTEMKSFLLFLKGAGSLAYPSVEPQWSRSITVAAGRMKWDK